MAFLRERKFKIESDQRDMVDKETKQYTEKKTSSEIKKLR